MNLATVVEMAAGYGDRDAVVTEAGAVSYLELLERVKRCAARLQGAADGAGQVAYLGLAGERYLEHLLGAAWAGLPFMPLNYRSGGEALAPLLDPFRPLLLVHDEAYAEKAAICLGAEDRGADSLATSGGEPGPVLEAYPFDGEALAVILNTSGTTSKPKAVLLRHRHLCSYIFGTVEFGSAGAEETALVCVPPYHIAGIMGVLTPLYAGRRLAFLPQFDPRGWLEAAQRFEVTHGFVVPTMLTRILDALEEEPGLRPEALRHLAYGGGPIHMAVVERALRLFPEVDFVNAYGLTETSSTVALLAPDDHRAAIDSTDGEVRARLGSVGRPLPGIEVRILDEDGSELPAGEVGLISIRGPQVSAHYHGAEAPSDGFASGDLGYIDAGGYLFVAGRSDDVIVRGGENISPGEVEEVLARHPRVAGVAVVGLPDEEWGQRVVAFIEGRGQQPTDEQLTTFCRGSLAGFKVPRDFVFLDELPRTDTGKVLRRRLQERYRDESAEPA